MAAAAFVTDEEDELLWLSDALLFVVAWLVLLLDGALLFVTEWLFVAELLFEAELLFVDELLFEAVLFFADELLVFLLDAEDFLLAEERLALWPCDRLTLAIKKFPLKMNLSYKTHFAFYSPLYSL